MKSPALKAGLIGAAIVLVLNLVGIIPVIGCIGLPLELIAYIAIGALAGFWMVPPRATGRAAGQGALAGLIAGIASGIIRAILTPLSMKLSGGTSAMLSQLPPESLQQLQQAGTRPERHLRWRHDGGPGARVLPAAWVVARGRPGRVGRADLCRGQAGVGRVA